MNDKPKEPTGLMKKLYEVGSVHKAEVIYNCVGTAMEVEVSGENMSCTVPISVFARYYEVNPSPSPNGILILRCDVWELCHAWKKWEEDDYREWHEYLRLREKYFPGSPPIEKK